MTCITKTKQSIPVITATIALLASQPASQPASQTDSQPASQPDSQPASQPARQTDVMTCITKTKQSIPVITATIALLASQPVSQPARQTDRQTDSQPVSQTASQPARQTDVMTCITKTKQSIPAITATTDVRCMWYLRFFLQPQPTLTSAWINFHKAIHLALGPKLCCQNNNQHEESKINYITLTPSSLGVDCFSANNWLCLFVNLRMTIKTRNEVDIKGLQEHRN